MIQRTVVQENDVAHGPVVLNDSKCKIITFSKIYTSYFQISFSKNKKTSALYFLNTWLVLNTL